MAHGVGSIFHGGCGGCSSGGFSSSTVGLMFTSHASTSSSRRRRNGDRGGGDNGCGIFMPFVLLIGAVAFLLCLVDMKPRTRIVLTWFYVITGGVLGGMLMWVANDSLSINASPSDEITIAPKSPVFCFSLTLDFYRGLDYYALTKPLQIDTNYTVEFSKDVSSCVSRDTYEYWGFYLLAGSTLSIKFDTSSFYGRPLTFYAIQGEDNFNKWKNDIDCLDCYIAKRQRISDTADFTITETNQYYFAFANQDMYVIPCSNVSVSFRIHRTRYTRANEEPLCLNSSDCTVKYPISGSRVVVVDIPDSATFDSEINVVCRPRLYMYVIVFGICPVLVGGIVTYILYRITIKRKQTSVSTKRAGHSVTNSIQNNVATASRNCHVVVNTTDERQAVMMKPPSYGEVLRSPIACTPPPTYEESMEGKV